MLAEARSEDHGGNGDAALMSGVIGSVTEAHGDHRDRRRRVVDDRSQLIEIPQIGDSNARVAVDTTLTEAVRR